MNRHILREEALVAVQSLPPNTWAWSLDHREVCRIVDREELWGDHRIRIWLPTRDITTRVLPNRLRPIGEFPHANPAWLSYVAAAARVADALTRDLLLAPIGGSVIPLPHQIYALSRAVSGDRVRYLLADEVGLGKTVEAGLIMRELKVRGLAKRILVVAPKGLVTQWIAEMQTQFGEEFRFLAPNDFGAFRRVQATDNVWRTCDQVVCSMDSVKPLEGRHGWSAERVAEYNRDRVEALADAGWDLIVVDEAHRLAGSTEQVARYKLGRALAGAAPHLLLLTATPHQGKSDAFRRLVSMVDKYVLPDSADISSERVQEIVIRTEKRRAMDSDGKPLFKPRRTRLRAISWTERHAAQRTLYEAVTEYAREGYNRAMLEKKRHVGFLMVLLQRLVTSSTRAIRTALERRLEALEVPDDQLTLFPETAEEEWLDLDAQERIDALLASRLKAMKNERAEVKLLLAAARHAERLHADVKAEALLDLIYAVQREEGDPSLKLLIFTEFVATQEMLRDFLEGRGFAVVCLNGTMDMEERIRVQRAFAEEARILVSTDAGGEGLNLQFCHVVINYDIPWNPMKLEQRIGRVDRIGQADTVRAVNFVIQDTVEHRVREVIEEKLAVILDELGIDKTGDILDSAQAARIFDDLYVEAIARPGGLEAKAESVAEECLGIGAALSASRALLGNSGSLDLGDTRSLMDHPLPHWINLMVSSYQEATGGDDARGQEVRNRGQRPEAGEVWHGTRGLEDPRTRSLATAIPPFAPGQPVPVLRIPKLPAAVRGYWSLWQISLGTPEVGRYRIMPLFLNEDGRTLGPTARFVWDQIMAGQADVPRHIDDDGVQDAFSRTQEAARERGRSLYRELARTHREALAKERRGGEQAFEARKRKIERVGLSEVRNHRMARLRREASSWRRELAERADAAPGLVPLVLAFVEGIDVRE